MASKKPKRSIPFDFILDELKGLNIHTKPMFGTHGIYVDDKIVFALRERETSLPDNGMWVATSVEHHESLKKEFPNLRTIQMFGEGETGWRVLPADADDFEEAALKVCALIRKKDIRIGKIPKSKLKSKKKKAKSRTSL